MSAATGVDPGSAGVLLVERNEGITAVTLNRPDKLNAFNADMVEALLAVVQACCHDGTRLLVLKGAGRNFSAGFDLGDYDAQSEGDLVLRFVRVEQLLQAVYHAPYQTLALAHGKNFGAGVDLVCACNRRLAAPDSTFRMPGLRFDLVLGTRRLVQRIGTDRAREVLAQSTTFNAQDAMAMGFIQGCAELPVWPDLVRAAAAEVAILSAGAMAALLRVTVPDERNADLAELVRSASSPGLKERLRRYRAQA